MEEYSRKAIVNGRFENPVRITDSPKANVHVQEEDVQAVLSEKAAINPLELEGNQSRVKSATRALQAAMRSVGKRRDAYKMVPGAAYSTNRLRTTVFGRNLRTGGRSQTAT